MTRETITFDFLGDALEVIWDGNVWVSPCNGQQHSLIGHAVRAECEYCIRASGDDPAEFGAEIDRAVDAAAAANHA